MNINIKRIISNRFFLLLLFLILGTYSICSGAQEFELSGLLRGNVREIELLLLSRLPRLISIIVTGASLSIAGLIMQTITSNRFVSPSTAGTNEWCRLGVMIAILFAGGENKQVKIIIAFIIAFAGSLLLIRLLQKLRVQNPIMIPLIGMMLGNVVSSITTFLANRYDMIQNMSSWLQGNFSLVVKGNYEMLFLGIPVLIIAYLYANQFTIAGMGEGFAISLGLNHKVVTMIGMGLVAFITTLVVVTIGSVPFVGLVVPNLIALYKGDNLKNTLFDTAVLGAIFLLICDIIGRSILAPYEVSISVVVSIVGSILFLILLLRKKG
ncbi:iron compound ABC uptake transporter permease protein [Lachnospiraceae bacterium KM106-2]|nr:iron compound ABC uptake transporter permease protein [Lachnospiraceae bacterium KM106-2]